MGYENPAESVDYGCEVCGRHCDDCICPICPVCQVQGDASCVDKHGLTYLMPDAAQRPIQMIQADINSALSNVLAIANDRVVAHSNRHYAELTAITSDIFVKYTPDSKITVDALAVARAAASRAVLEADATDARLNRASIILCSLCTELATRLAD